MLFTYEKLLTHKSILMWGARLGRKGRQWLQRPLRQDHLDAGQETQAGDEDQEEDSQPQVERDFFLWRFVSSLTATQQISGGDLNWKFKLDFSLHHKLG